MNKILVPTDFSKNAEKAVLFAITISNRFEAEITLYHVYHVGSSAAETFVSRVDEIVREDKEKAMKEVIEKWEPHLKKGRIQGKIARGDVEDLIISKADHNHFDLIVMGTEGDSGMKKFFFGSTALAVIRRSKTPVVAIPKDAEPKQVHNIVLAVDGHGISSPDLLAPLVKLAKLRKATIKIFHKMVQGDVNELHPSIAEALKGLKYTYYPLETQTDDISDSIKAFVDEQGNTDLLCLINRRKGLLGRLFKENVTSDSLIESPIPLLVFKD